jgi:hypothetical protein
MAASLPRSVCTSARSQERSSRVCGEEAPRRECEGSSCECARSNPSSEHHRSLLFFERAAARQRGNRAGVGYAASRHHNSVQLATLLFGLGRPVPHDLISVLLARRGVFSGAAAQASHSTHFCHVRCGTVMRAQHWITAAGPRDAQCCAISRGNRTPLSALLGGVFLPGISLELPCRNVPHASRRPRTGAGPGSAASGKRPRYGLRTASQVAQLNLGADAVIAARSTGVRNRTTMRKLP